MSATAQSDAAVNGATATTTRNMLILQGGGALGAYECGVYRALAEGTFLDDLHVVAGTSIGGINASLIARHFHEPRHGADFLERFWREQLATPSWTFFPPVFPLLDERDRWNAVWTSFLVGHPRLFRPNNLWPVPWILRAPPSWTFETHFYDAGPMEEVLARPGFFGSYRGDDPRLIVTAVDVQEGTSATFDSGVETLTAAHVVAGASLPPSYPPKQVKGPNGGYFWDGGIWSNTPLHEALAALRATANGAGQETRYRVCIVDTFPRTAARLPATNGEVHHRLNELAYADKTHDDVTATQWVNEYVDLVLTLRELDRDLPPSLKEAIARMIAAGQLDHFQEIVDHQRIHVDITAIPREAYPDEERELISSEIDFSPERIDELIAQGYAAGTAHIEELQRAPRACGASGTQAGAAPAGRPHVPYTVTNSKGKPYYLHCREVTLRGTGAKQVIYFFAGDVREGAIDALPPGRVVQEQPSGLPVLKKA